jgi:uncharacterized protein YdeI (YjbR/CyaY-like superfamily)
MGITKDVETYFEAGCGRCSLGGTPQCKVHKWEQELALLRRIVLDCGLHEKSKWGIPCYTFQNKNVLVVAAFKEYCSISFFKGALLSDKQKVLIKPGEESQSARYIAFTKIADILKAETNLKAKIFEAIEVEKAGLNVNYKSIEEQKVPIEFQNVLNKDPKLKSAFEALSPGKRRGYLLHFSGAKQSSTRITRIEKSTPKILQGKGMMD